jgi:hypothetical protein
MDDDFTGTWIPAMVWELLDNGEISPTEFLIAITADRFMDPDGLVRIYEDSLTDLLRLDKTRHKLRWYLKRLDHKGLVEIVSTSLLKGRRVWVLRTWSLPHDALMKIVRNHERQT